MLNFNNPAKAAFQFFAMAALMVYGMLAYADNAQDLRQRQRVYQIDRQQCLSGHSGQALDSCLQEAGAVLQQAPAAQTEVGAAQLQDNALQRCDALPDDQRQSCVARIQGQGTTQGGVQAGGVLRTLREPAQ